MAQGCRSCYKGRVLSPSHALVIADGEPMKSTSRPSKSSRQTVWIISTILGISAAPSLSPIFVHAQEVPVPESTVSQPAQALQPSSPGSAGMRIYIDPDTGEIGRPPAGSRAGVLEPAFSTSSQGLVEEPSPESGIMVDLQGRFRSPLMATIGPDGKLSIGHHIPVHPPITDTQDE